MMRALTIAIAVCASLLVALTILPAVSKTYLKPKKLTANHAPRWSRMTGFLMRASGTPVRRGAIIGTLIAGPLLMA